MSIQYGLFDQSGVLLSKLDSVSSKNGEKSVLDILLGIVSETIKSYSIKGICVASSGVIDSEKGEVIYSGYTIPEYKGTQIKKTIETIFNLPCEVENDVNCTALGEYWKGSGKGSNSLVCLTIGTGIGGAIMLGGSIYHGKNYSAGEIGYMKVSNENIQDIASATSLIERVGQKKKVNLNGKEIFEAAKTGDEVSIEEIDYLLENLSVAIINIMYLLSPEKIIVAGGIINQKDYLYEKLLTKVAANIEDTFFNNSTIVFAENNKTANLLGALFHFKKLQNID
ncbi:hypothetical protein CBF29_09990 [Vagococcus elongatus]|uniref:ROK family protein n=2 Tax=Vagococcus elongatus TaxID=180344 RepID=A0A430AQE0_9ENTE|nr:hypothetical protein CBF29_09990 [Vagococcus elongatus]